MMSNPPGLSALESQLDRYGSDLARWPRAEAAAARRLLNDSAEARRMLREAEVLDRLLDASLPAPAYTGLPRRAAILDAVRRTDALTGLLEWFRRGPWLWRPVAMALIPLAIGFGAGAGVGLPSDGASEDELITELHLLAFDGIEEYRDAE